MPKCPIQNLWTIVPATFSLLENFHAQFKFGAHFRFYLGPISLHTTSFSSSARPTGNRVRAPRGAEPPPRFHVQSDLLRLQRRALECLPSRLPAPSSLEPHAADLVTRRPCLAPSRRLRLSPPLLPNPRREAPLSAGARAATLLLCSLSSHRPHFASLIPYCTEDSPYPSPLPVSTSELQSVSYTPSFLD